MTLPYAKTQENGVIFETGRSVSFPFIRNTEKSPYLGSRFQQDIEPAGRYLLHNEIPYERNLARGWTHGNISFRSPLVLRFSESGRYDAGSWKAALVKHYKAKNRKLSRRILADGHDGIVTVGDDGATREIVDLNVLRSERDPERKPVSSFRLARRRYWAVLQAYLEKHYGRVPTSEGHRVADEAFRRKVPIRDLARRLARDRTLSRSVYEVEVTYLNRRRNR